MLLSTDTPEPSCADNMLATGHSNVGDIIRELGLGIKFI